MKPKKRLIVQNDEFTKGKTFEIEVSASQAVLIRDALDGKAVDSGELANIIDMLGDLQDGILNSFIS